MAGLTFRLPALKAATAVPANAREAVTLLGACGIQSGDVGCHQAKTMVDLQVSKHGNEQITPAHGIVLHGKLNEKKSGFSIAMFHYRRVPKSQNEFYQYGKGLARPCQFPAQSLKFRKQKLEKIQKQKGKEKLQQEQILINKK